MPVPHSLCPAPPLHGLSPNQPTTTSPTLITSHPQPPDTAERTARHLRLCQELIELGMTLAREAAARALSDMAQPPPTVIIPASSAAAIAQAEDAARHRAPDYGRTFAQLSRAVRQTMLLEAHIAEGRAARTSQITPHPAANTDAPPSPSRDTLRLDPLDRLDCALPTGPDGEIPIEALLQTTGDLLAGTAAPQANTIWQWHPPAPEAHHTPPTTQHPTQPARMSRRRW